MADNDSQLTQEQKEAAIAWLNDHGAQEPSCPGCGQKKWTVGDYLVAPPIYSGSGLMLGGPAYPNFMIICQNCGNTQFFNAVLSKIVEPDKEEEEEKPVAVEEIEEASDG